MQDETSLFIFGFRLAIQNIVAHETEQFEDGRQTFENINQIAQNGDDA